jgi:hypothetical protein
VSTEGGSMLSENAFVNIDRYLLRPSISLIYLHHRAKKIFKRTNTMP